MGAHRDTPCHRATAPPVYEEVTARTSQSSRRTCVTFDAAHNNSLLSDVPIRDSSTSLFGVLPFSIVFPDDVSDSSLVTEDSFRLVLELPLLIHLRIKTISVAAESQKGSRNGCNPYPS